jgi:hypothetical protein|tara:strand:- start:380 stop:1348 length:969 start_codon:yes stop_codon:yes gene_type:complete
MKFFLFILLVSFTFLSSSFAKILNIENKIQIEVPSSHKFIRYDNAEIMESINEFKDSIDGMEVDFYLVGPSKYVNLEQALFIDGEDPMENEYIKSIIKKYEGMFERKMLQDPLKAGKWVISEIKKIMKKEKIDFITYAFVINKTLIEMFSGEDEIIDILTDLQSMNNSELIKQTKEIKKQIASIEGASKTKYAFGPTTITYNKLKIDKNKNGNLFLKGPSKFFMAINETMTIDALLNFYLGEHNNRTYGFISVCYVDCSKFNSKFDKMIKPVFSKIEKNVKTKTTNSSNNDLVEQLEQLNSLYKSGVLTKEEFEKAKKKILN